MMPNIQLDSHWIEFECDSLITERPRFLIESNVVALGPYLDQAEHERAVLQTVGSVDWFSTVEVDEFRFCSNSGLLQSVALRVPEYRAIPGAPAVSWADIEDLRATPRLIDIENFQIAPTAYRVFDRGALLCLRGDFNVGSMNLGRVYIAPTLSLLIVAGKYVGWCLEDAALALEDSDESSSNIECDDELSCELGKYLEVVSFPNLNLIFDSDAPMRERLEEISSRLQLTVGAYQRRSILITQIDKLISDWYR